MAIIIKKKPNLEKLSVSELYTTLTGKPWSTAKAEGLTNGSYSQNMALRTKLLTQVAGDNKSEPRQEMEEGWFADTPKETKKETKEKIHDFSKANSFGSAFNAANELLGENAVFRFKGKMFTTNLGKTSIKKADKEEEWDEEELPLDDIVLSRSTKKSDADTNKLVNEAIQLDMQNMLYRPSMLSDDMIHRNIAKERQRRNKANWISRNITQMYKGGGILPYKYKNGGDDDKKNKNNKKKMTYSETPKTMEATKYSHGKKKVAPWPKASASSIAQMKAMKAKDKKKKQDTADKAKNK